MARKRKRKGFGALGFIVIVAILGLLYTVVSGDRPLLGLDLQGGVSVVLKPRDDNVPAANLEQAKRIIDKRINALGVAESEVTIQGNTILVQIPGVKDKDRALKLVGQTAELQFRPVLAVYPAAVGLLGRPPTPPTPPRRTARPTRRPPPSTRRPPPPAPRPVRPPPARGPWAWSRARARPGCRPTPRRSRPRPRRPTRTPPRPRSTPQPPRRPPRPRPRRRPHPR